MMTAWYRRLAGKWRRFTTARYGRRDLVLRSEVPYISFTFDDFPRSAAIEGARILAGHGVRGTFFVSAKLVAGPSVSGPIASVEDMHALVAAGHELGCHTFEHLDGTRSTAAAFERSITVNHAAVASMVAHADLQVFAYPLDGPVLGIKKTVGPHFAACRGGGQRINAGTIDLNLLNAYFLDYRNSGDHDAIRRIVAENAAARGWLIFATHDVAASPSRYGCDPEMFAATVKLAVKSGARVLPMGDVLEALRVARVSRVA